MFHFFRHSMLVKVLGLILLTLLLCIPLGQIELLTRERGASQQEAGDELAATYAGAQTLVGPMLVVPYSERWIEPQRDALGKVIGREERRKELVHLVFPDKLHIEGSLAPQERYRGIFRIPFYTLAATLDGVFAPFDKATVAPTEKDSTLEFKAPFVAMDVSDLRGLDGSPTLQIGPDALRFQQRVPGLPDGAWLARGIHAPLAGASLSAWAAGEPFTYRLTLRLVGKERLSMVPIAEDTTAHLVSSWAHPNFGGHFLASERSVTDKGFDARWRVSSLVSSARDQVRGGLLATVARDATTADARAPLQSFDVTLAQPLNVYAMSTRAAKYGLLFIGLVLMAAFMFELFRKLRLHPVQYGLVGLSIAIFFLLLLALSEKFAFGLAYGGAATASVLLLATYFSAVLGDWRRGASFGAFVALLYAALYGLLASESNALLLGALLIFGMLALLMLATRRVDWYALSAVTASDVDATATATSVKAA